MEYSMASESELTGKRHQLDAVVTHLQLVLQNV